MQRQRKLRKDGLKQEKKWREEKKKIIQIKGHLTFHTSSHLVWVLGGHLDDAEGGGQVFHDGDGVHVLAEAGKIVVHVTHLHDHHARPYLPRVIHLWTRQLRWTKRSDDKYLSLFRVLLFYEIKYKKRAERKIKYS